MNLHQYYALLKGLVLCRDERERKKTTTYIYISPDVKISVFCLNAPFSLTLKQGSERKSTKGQRPDREAVVVWCVPSTLFFCVWMRRGSAR